MSKNETIVPPSRWGRSAMMQIYDEFSTAMRKDKFAPVGPCRIYTGLREAGYIPDNILLLAHDVVSQADVYHEEFGHSEWNNCNIIMDNSVVETGGAVDASMVFEAAECVSADVVVLPDVLKNGPESTKATLDAWPLWNWKFRDYEKMAVIQGRDINEWLVSLETISNEIGGYIEWVSVPRVAQLIEGYDRRELLGWVERLMPTAKVHLLGFSDEMHKDIEAARHHMVKSIDSAVPLRMASKGIYQMLGQDCGPRGDWFETVEFNPLMVDNCQRFNSYIG